MPVVLHVASQLILNILLFPLQMNVFVGNSIEQVLHPQGVLPGLVEGGLVTSALTRRSCKFFGLAGLTTTSELFNYCHFQLLILAPSIQTLLMLVEKL